MVSRRSQVVTNTTNITFAADSGLPVFNVKDATYGAVGNGTTDDTTAIQAAITAAEAQTYYATVFLPFGYYKITAPLVITRPIRFIGEGCVVGDRLKNNNYAAKGAVIWNASTSADAIQFTPSTVSGLWPRGLGGMIFQDFGIDTPEVGGSAVTTTNSAGWGPHSTGCGIAISGTASHYGYYVKLSRVTVCRHYSGFRLNTGYATSAYGTGSIDLDWCNALLCRTAGFDCRSVEARLNFCRAKNNDPEWSSYGGSYGFLLGADGGFYNSCIAISCDVGFSCPDGNGFHNLVGCGADSCPQPYVITSTGAAYPSALTNCWGTACYWDPSSGLYPASNEASFDVTGGILNACYSKVGHVKATDSTVNGGIFPGAQAYGRSLFSGVQVNSWLGGGLVRQSGFTGTVVGCDLTAGLSGSAGSSKGRGNIGQSDWG